MLDITATIEGRSTFAGVVSAVAEQLFIPGPRRAFLEILETAKSPAELLLFPKLTSGTPNADEGTRQRNYLLPLELVEVENGTIVARESERVRKAYTR